MNKAYMVFPGNDPYDDGCVLTFAKSRNEARTYTMAHGPWVGYTYTEMSARRVKRFDRHVPVNCPCLFDTNEGLPEPFFTDEI